MNISAVTQKPLDWQLARWFLARSESQAFLDRRMIGWILRFARKGKRKVLALKLLSLSPHYFIYQWSDRYRGASREEVLRREWERNAASRRSIVQQLIRPYLQPHMHVLDFGCGPGFLSREAARHARQVTALDVSRGVLACAHELNSAENVRYLVNRRPDLALLNDSSFDFVYSVAVIQHLDKELTGRFFVEFARILKPGAMGLCHFVLAEDAASTNSGSNQPGSWVKRGLHLRMDGYTSREIRGVLEAAGLEEVAISPIADLASIPDDVGREHVVLFRRPAAA